MQIKMIKWANIRELWVDKGRIRRRISGKPDEEFKGKRDKNKMN